LIAFVQEDCSLFLNPTALRTVYRVWQIAE